MSNIYETFPPSVLPSEIIYVDSLSKLPSEQNGVIHLGNDGKQYFFTKSIDVDGVRVDFGNNILVGTSQELAGIKNGVIEINQTCGCQFIRFDSCTMEINAIDGAFDWQFVNFYDCNDISIINAQNIIWQTFGFINSYNLQITGELDSFVLAPNCIFRSVTTESVDFFAIRSTATINRRVRIEDTVFSTSFSNQNPINVESGATIPIESLRLEDISFNGSGQLQGINGDSDMANFRGCSGSNVINSTSIANMYIIENQTSTPTPNQGQKYKVVGVTSVGPEIQRFTHDSINNTLQYTSSIPRIFKIQMPYTVFAGNNNVVGVYIAITRSGDTEDPDTDVIEESEMYTTTNGSRPISGMSQCVITVNLGDKIYMAVENNNGNTVRVEFSNMIVETANV